MPDLMRYEVKHSYILELKYLSVKDTEEKARTQWQEAVKQINEYAAAPRVRQLVQNTKLHCIIIQFRGWELERMEEVKACSKQHDSTDENSYRKSIHIQNHSFIRL